MPFDTPGGDTVQRAYSFLTVKAVDDGHTRTIEGIATTPAMDRVGDVIDPMGARFAKSAPLLWQHDHGQPVGSVKFGKPTAKGIEFAAQIKKPKPDYPKALADRLDEAWVSVRDGLIGAVSIGFRASDYERLEDGGVRFTDYEIIELSLVTIPANAEATINAIKSADRRARAASGNSPSPVRLSTARVRALKNPTSRKETVMSKTISEQISAWQAELDRKEAKRTAIQTKALEEGRAKDADESEQFDDLTAEIKAIKKELADLHEIEGSTVEKSLKPIVENKAMDQEPPRDRRTTVLGPNSNVPKGIAFARTVLCKAYAKLENIDPAKLAEQYYPDDLRIRNYLQIPSTVRAAVPAAYTGDSGGWAETIAEAQTVENEFIEFLRPMSVLDRMEGVRRVQFNVKYSRMSTGQTGSWVGENLPIPLTSGAFDPVTLGKTKVGGISVLTREQMLFSNINAETAIAGDLAAAIVQAADSKFLSADAAAAGVSPAGLLNGVSAISSAGDTAENVRTDLVNLFEPMSAANISRSTVTYVTTENIHFALGNMQSTLGVMYFPTVLDGTLSGRPILASNSAGGGDLIAISAPNILVALGGVEISMSDQASLEMLDGSLVQDGTDGTGASLWSTWQNEAVAIKVTRFANWAKARAAAVQYIGDATYQGAATA
jgi:HK97 family phage major capsid protein/HK97 family phage prohead protease